MYQIDDEYRSVVAGFSWWRTPKGYWRRASGIPGPSKMHRFVWWLHHGSCPAILDHVNGDRSDNRLANLRPATPTLNSLNRRVRMYVEERRGKYRCEVKYHGKRHRTRFFATREEAIAAREELLVGFIGVEAALSRKAALAAEQPPARPTAPAPKLCPLFPPAAIESLAADIANAPGWARDGQTGPSPRQ